MIRVKRSLKDQLLAFGASMVEPLLKQQGNHEDNQSDGPPLWWVIEELLSREKKHRRRGKSNSVPIRYTAPSRVKYGARVKRPEQPAEDDGGVYTAREKPPLEEWTGE